MKKEKKYIVELVKITSKILVLSIIMSIFIGSVYADGYSIVITEENNTSLNDININASTIDIPIEVSGYEDIYAFSIKLDYVPGIVIESIALGNVFENYGNAVLVNKIDNENRTAEFMQTLLSVEKGVKADKVLCTLRITFSEGEYDISEDLKLEVKIANSVPEYVDAYIPSVKIIVENTTQDTQATPTPTLEPVTTAAIGIVTPDPESETSQEFAVAEDEDIETILEEINQMEEEQNATFEPESFEETMSPSSTEVLVDNSVTPEANIKQSDDSNGNVMSIILIITLVLLIAVLVMVIIFRYRVRNKEVK